MPQRLTGMRIDRVSTVDKGANGREFALFKRDETVSRGTPEADAGLIARIGDIVAKALRLGPESTSTQTVKKTRTFAEIVAGQEMQEALSDSWYTLQDALWSAIYATDENGADLDIAAKQTLVAQNLDEFKAYLLAAMERGIVKRGAIRKVGRKISADRMKRLKEAGELIAQIVSEASDETEKTEKRDDTQEEVEVEKAELEQVLAKALEPVVKRLDALEGNGTTEEGVEKSAEPGDGEVAEPIAKAISALADRIEKLERRPSQRTAADGQEGGTVKKSSQWAGVL